MEQSQEYNEDNTIIFNDEDALVSYLKYNILNDYRYSQLFNKIRIIKEKIKEEDFKLEINDYSSKIIINFDFSLYNILKKLHYSIDKEANPIIINYVIDFRRVDFNCITRFDNIIFNNRLLFLDVNFKNNVIFNNSEFDDLHIISCINKDYFYFKNIKINKILRLILSEYNQNNSISFNDLKFLNYNSILYINGESNKLRDMKITDTIINGKINIVNIEVQKVNFIYSTVNSGVLYTVNFKVHKFANRESALFLKQQAYARNNAIDALEYKAKEVEKHKEDLIKDWKNNKNLKTLGDILSIELSSIYSDNGQNWIRAFICTILFPTVFFTLSYNIYNIPIFIFVLDLFIFILCDNTKITKYIFYSFITYLIISFLYMFNDNSHLNFIKELFSFLTPTNFNQIVYNNENPSYIHSNNTSYIQLIFKGISYFIGKIAFWYGSVQTVTAFRKFAKGA